MPPDVSSLLVHLQACHQMYLACMCTYKHATGSIQPNWCTYKYATGCNQRTYKHATSCIQPVVASISASMDVSGHADVPTSTLLAVSIHAEVPKSTPMAVSSLLVQIQARYWLYPPCQCNYKHATGCIQPACAPTSTLLAVYSLQVHLQARFWLYPVTLVHLQAHYMAVSSHAGAPTCCI
jgi:hypothetical protein